MAKLTIPRPSTVGAHSLHFNVHIVERAFLRSWTRMVRLSFFTISKLWTPYLPLAAIATHQERCSCRSKTLFEPASNIQKSRNRCSCRSKTLCELASITQKTLKPLELSLENALRTSAIISPVALHYRIGSPLSLNMQGVANICAIIFFSAHGRARYCQPNSMYGPPISRSRQ